MSANLSEFTSLDPDLPSIAALAAAEIDDVLRDRHSGLGNVSRLAEVLRASFSESSQSTSGARKLLDPISAGVFTRTFRDAQQSNMNSYEELAKVSLALAEQLKTAADIVDSSLLEGIKSFCLALSKYALASKERIASLPTSSDHKR